MTKFSSDANYGASSDGGMSPLSARTSRGDGTASPVRHGRAVCAQRIDRVRTELIASQSRPAFLLGVGSERSCHS